MEQCKKTDASFRVVQNQVSGYVLDHNMRPIADVIVSEVDRYGARVSNFGVATNSDGEFSIQVQNTANQLLFEHLEYDYDTFPINTIESYVQLYPSNNVLDDVLITNPFKKSKWLLWLLIGAAGAYGLSRFKKN